MPKISVIIPTYNSKNFLSRCIDSILHQSFKDFEVIFIDAFSVDWTCEIINNYIKEDNRIRPIISNKCWPWMARNLWIQVSLWKYIMFIDSDDYVDFDYFEKYYNEIEKSGYDIVIWWKKNVSNNWIKKQFIKNNKYSKWSSVWPWCRIINSKFLKENNIIFSDINIWEDAYFNYTIYNKTDKIWILKNIWYNFFLENNNSLTHVLWKTLQKRFIEYMDNIYSLESVNRDNKNIMNFFIVYSAFLNIISSWRYSDYNSFMKYYKNILSWFHSHDIKYIKLIYIYIFKPLWEPLFYRLVVFIFLLIHQLHLVPLFAKIITRSKKVNVKNSFLE